MRKATFRRAVGLLLGICLGALSCTGPPPARPVPARAIDTLSLPFDRLTFTAAGADWQASLLSYVQPIALELEPTDSGFELYPLLDWGLIEGPAHLCLRQGTHAFYYPVYLVNRLAAAGRITDYRSPKTVNPDSSLSHQQILVAIDRWRNVAPLGSGSELFRESILATPATAGIYRAQTERPLSSYYVQPGSAIALPLSARFQAEAQHFAATAGPLQDEYGNRVADGTVVTFIYDDGVYTRQTEAVVRDGFARAYLPVALEGRFTLFARIDATRSATLQLQVP